MLAAALELTSRFPGPERWLTRLISLLPRTVLSYLIGRSGEPADREGAAKDR